MEIWPCGNTNHIKSYHLSMSLHTLNSLHLVPKQDSVANQLVSGALQLARNTALFLDEMQLEQGQLDTSGVWNIPALGNLISWQKVDYDFNKMEFPCNINVLITSEGRSLLPVRTDKGVKSNFIGHIRNTI
ncbi:mini-chromosome maintenance complex-binding protein-like [Salvelinus fontinalis]|uniref:mini-chromosome maintenance complex-binding protein-like n=1 Tax=Salvelinus fontinalis TaxID=8038 RepID=UPI0024868D54|nr:mini-chromosome maintenance complex-binding protein-like [Salvelinus fontinalis]